MPELKECPFCGGEAWLMDYFKRNYWVKCLKCGGQTMVFKENAERAITSWNRRVNDDKS